MVSRLQTTTHHSRWDSSGRVISSSQRPLPDNTQHSQQTDIHAPGGIRTYNPSKRAAVDLRLRPRGHWNPQIIYVLYITDVVDTTDVVILVENCIHNIPSMKEGSYPLDCELVSLFKIRRRV